MRIRPMPAPGARDESLPGAIAGRQAEPVLPFSPAVPPAPLWAAATRPRAESVHPRGGARRNAFGGVLLVRALS